MARVLFEGIDSLALEDRRVSIRFLFPFSDELLE